MNHSQHPYLQVMAHVDEIAKQCGKDPTSLLLVGVTKNHSISDIMKAYQAGCRDFGESRVQEALEKINHLPSDIHWHFIGNLQSNKVNKIVGRFDLIHSVDSFEIAQKISQCSLKKGVITSILLEVNTSGEITKHGFTIDHCKEKIASIVALPGISVKGLMTMAPLTEDRGVIRQCFADLRRLRDDIMSGEFTSTDFKELSMGMSTDYPEAILKGATILRIGSAIFKQN